MRIHATRSSTRQTGRRPAPFVIGNNRGVSLIETLVALSLFSVITATMGDFLVDQVRAAASNNRHTDAYVIAAEQLERLRARSFDRMAASSTEEERGNVTYTVDTTVADNTPAAHMKQITVDVSWDEPGGTQNVSVHTIYTGVRG